MCCISKTVCFKNIKLCVFEILKKIYRLVFLYEFAKKILTLIICWIIFMHGNFSLSVCQLTNMMKKI